MNILLLLSGVILANKEPNKTYLETITGIKIVEQGKVPVIAKKVTSKTKNAQKKKKTVQKKKKTIKKSTKKVQKKKVVKKKATKTTKYNYRYNVGEIQHYMNILNAEYGWSNDDYIAWLMIVKRESSFNPYAINKKSKATGLCQALPGKKMASHGKDWRTNYKTQLRWCRDYIKNRYGTPQQAWSFWQSHHWF